MKMTFGSRSFATICAVAHLVFLEPEVALARLGADDALGASRELLQTDTITAAPVSAPTLVDVSGGGILDVDPISVPTEPPTKSPTKAPTPAPTPRQATLRVAYQNDGAYGVDHVIFKIYDGDTGELLETKDFSEDNINQFYLHSGEVIGIKQNVEYRENYRITVRVDIDGGPWKFGETGPAKKPSAFTGDKAICFKSGGTTQNNNRIKRRDNGEKWTAEFGKRGGKFKCEL